MDSRIDIIEKKIKEMDQWYVGDQLVLSISRFQKYEISSRKKYILETIRKIKDGNDGNLKVLDLGCGDGVYIDLLSRMESLSVSGTDINMLRLKRAKDRFAGVEFFQSDACNLPFKSGFFDIVLASHIFEHINEDSQALKEAGRILSPRGFLIIGIPNEGCFLAQIRNKILQRKISNNSDHCNYYNENIFIEKLNRIGFEVIDILRIGFFIPHTQLFNAIVRFKIGYQTLSLLGNIFKGQCAGLMFVCKKV